MVCTAHRRPGPIPPGRFDLDLTHGDGNVITATADYDGFEDWWSRVPLGVGPMGVLYRTLDDDRRQQWRARARQKLGQGDEPLRLSAEAWCAVGTV